MGQRDDETRKEQQRPPLIEPNELNRCTMSLKSPNEIPSHRKGNPRDLKESRVLRRRRPKEESVRVVQRRKGKFHGHIPLLRLGRIVEKPLVILRKYCQEFARSHESN